MPLVALSSTAPGGQWGFRSPQGLAEAVGGNHHQDQPGAVQGRREFLGEGEAGGEPHPGQKGVVDPVPAAGLRRPPVP